MLIPLRPGTQSKIINLFIFKFTYIYYIIRGAFCPLNPVNKTKMDKQEDLKGKEIAKLEGRVKEYEKVLRCVLEEKKSTLMSDEAKKRSSESESDFDLSDDEYQMEYSDFEVF